MSQFSINAELRADMGKGASRRLRRLADKLPGIVYGGKESPTNITLLHKDITKALEDESFYSHIIALNIGDKSEKVVLKSLQRHPAKNRILHVDFLRVTEDRAIHTKVPLHFINEAACVGVKVQGGRISHNLTILEVSCLPSHLPEFIEIDMKDINAGEVIHISQVKMPEGVEAVELKYGASHDLPVVTVLTKASGEGEEGKAAEGEKPKA